MNQEINSEDILNQIRDIYYANINGALAYITDHREWNKAYSKITGIHKYKKILFQIHTILINNYT